MDGNSKSESKERVNDGAFRVVHSGDRVGFEWVSFDLVVFQIRYFSDACYGGSHSDQVG